MSQFTKSGVFHPAFSPWLANPEQLSRTLVGNEGIIRDFLARLAAMDTGSSANHVLLVGPRGIGKTHILCLTGHFVSRRLPLPQDWTIPSSEWICALFTEEEYAGQNSLASFLLTLFEKLVEILPGESLLCLPSDLSTKPDNAVIDCCFETLDRFHEKTGKRLLILVDNLQKILQQWSTEDHHKLRKFLSACRFTAILGSAPSVFREVMDQKAAFHDFFEIRILSELAANQVMELMEKRFQEDQRAAEFNARREELSRKMAAIEVLTGGNPRLILFLYQIATGSAFWEIETALRALLEELREYFVRRFDELPGQARKILDTIAQMQGPATPTEIAAAARLSPQLVNAQLQRLKTGHLVRQIKLKRQRTTRYDITERLFRIWRQTATVAGRQRFKFLADFLRLYYTPDEIQNLYQQHAADLTSSTEATREEILRHVEDLFYFQAGGEGKVRYDAFTNRIQSLLKLGETHLAEEEAKYFKTESYKTRDKTGFVEACKQELTIHIEVGRLSEALDDLNKLSQIHSYKEAANGAEIIIQKNPDCAAAWLYLAIASNGLGNYERVLDAVPKSTGTAQSTQLLILQSLALSGLNRNEEALKIAEQAVNLDSSNSESWIALGIAANNLEDSDRAFHAFSKIVEISSPWEYMRLLSSALLIMERETNAYQVVCQTLSNISQDSATSTEIEYTVEALYKVINFKKVTNELLRLYSSSCQILDNEGTFLESDISNNETTYSIWNVLSLMLNILGRYDESLRAAEKHTSLKPNNFEIWKWLCKKAIHQARYDQALDIFNRATKAGAPATELFQYKLIALQRLNRIDEALQATKQVTEIAPEEPLGWLQLAWAYRCCEQFNEALSAIERAAANGASARDVGYARGNILLFAGRYEEASRALGSGFDQNPDNWQIKAYCKISSACLGEYGPLMEALPAQLLMAKIPSGSEQGMCEFMRKIMVNAIRRNETSVPRGLWNALLSIESYHELPWHGPLCGDFLRRLLEIAPGKFVEYAELLSEKVKNDSTLRLLDPFLQSAVFIKTKDVTILERLFPEIRELVFDIVRRVSPDLITQLRI